jgi:hypothetical protein
MNVKNKWLKPIKKDGKKEKNECNKNDRKVESKKFKST